MSFLKRRVTYVDAKGCYVVTLKNLCDKSPKDSEGTEKTPKIIK